MTIREYLKNAVNIQISRNIPHSRSSANVVSRCLERITERKQRERMIRI